MYLGIDIGGTKTLVAVLDGAGKITQSRRFPTDKDYGRFLSDLETNLAELPLEDDYTVCAAVPGLLDRRAGTVQALGNLPWHDEPIRSDIAKLVGGRHVFLENDARLAGLSEAILIHDTYQDRVLFATVSTGIGGALIHGGRIVSALKDTEMGKMPLMYDGELAYWEDFAGGRGVVERFHKKAMEITDPEEWRQLGETVAYGLGAACSILQPEVIVLGGSVGTYADKYGDTVLQWLETHLHPVVRRPKAVLPAQRPDEAVIYGCYELLKAEDSGGSAYT